MKSFAEIFLEYAANSLVCGHNKMCTNHQTISEYELYFQYARLFFPSTIIMRPLLWANGPRPGLLYWPTVQNYVPLLTKLSQWYYGNNDDNMRDYYDVRNSDNWLGPSSVLGNMRNIGGIRNSPIINHHNINKHLNTMPMLSSHQKRFFDMQIMVDKSQGFHYVAYHAHAAQRGFELCHDDIEALSNDDRLKKIDQNDDNIDDQSCSLIGKVDNMDTMHTNVNPRELPALFRGCAIDDLKQIQLRRNE